MFYKCKYKNQQFKKHFHTTYSIGAVISGVHYLKIGKKEFEVKEGEIKIINPYELHLPSGEWEYINFMPSVSEIKKASIDIFEKEKLTFKNSIRDFKIFRQFFRFYESVDKFEREENFLLLISQFLKYEEKECLTLDSKIKDSVEFIHSNFVNINLDDVAKVSNLSKYHFIRIFAKKKGITPYQYILNLRIEFARELINKLPLSIVAQEAGFSDESHMIREFKKRFGFTPKKLYNS